MATVRFLAVKAKVGRHVVRLITSRRLALVTCCSPWPVFLRPSRIAPLPRRHRSHIRPAWRPRDLLLALCLFFSEPMVLFPLLLLPPFPFQQHILKKCFAVRSVTIFPCASHMHHARGVIRSHFGSRIRKRRPVGVCSRHPRPANAHIGVRQNRSHSGLGGAGGLGEVARVRGKGFLHGAEVRESRLAA